VPESKFPIDATSPPIQRERPTAVTANPAISAATKDGGGEAGPPSASVVYDVVVGALGPAPPNPDDDPLAWPALQAKRGRGPDRRPVDPIEAVERQLPVARGCAGVDGLVPVA